MASLFSGRRIKGWWRFSGLAAAGTAARAFFGENGKNVLFYRHLRSDTVIVIASGEDAQADLRAWFADRVARKGE